MTQFPLKLLFVSTPVGPLGSGIGGGVELTILNTAKILRQRGYQITVVAPVGSVLPSIPVVEIEGQLQTSAQTQIRQEPMVMPDNAVLANMWDYAHQVQGEYDLVVNFAYDWLPFFLTPFFSGKIAHLVSMSSLTDTMDRLIKKVSQAFPKSIAFHTKAQAATFDVVKGYFCLGNGLDLSQYQYEEKPQNQLAWLGRISPEKGLEDAVAAAQITGILLLIMGKIQDQNYWQNIRQIYPDAPIEYLGFLSTEKLQEKLGQCRALIMTSRWVEAFGNVAIEALACGVPVISYRRGGPAEIIQDGKTGWLVEPDQIEGLVTAISQLDQINRSHCRQQAEKQYSLEALGDRTEKWFHQILTQRLDH